MASLHKLKELIHESGYKLDHISNKMGITRAGLYNKINGYTEFKLSEVDKLSNILNLSKIERNVIFFDDQRE